MITLNYRKLLTSVLQLGGGSGSKGMIPVTGRDGITYYLSGSLNGSSYPYSASYGFTTSATSTGIAVGGGTTAPTIDDYDLESQITSGLSASSVVTSKGLDGDGNPYIQFDLTLSNTSSGPITISEIGYRQNLYTATAADATSFSTRLFLIDRTVLDSPVTIAAGSYGFVRYTLKTMAVS